MEGYGPTIERSVRLVEQSRWFFLKICGSHSPGHLRKQRQKVFIEVRIRTLSYGFKTDEHHTTRAAPEKGACARNHTDRTCVYHMSCHPSSCLLVFHCLLCNAMVCYWCTSSDLRIISERTPGVFASVSKKCPSSCVLGNPSSLHVHIRICMHTQVQVHILTSEACVSDLRRMIRYFAYMSVWSSCMCSSTNV